MNQIPKTYEETAHAIEQGELSTDLPAYTYEMEDGEVIDIIQWCRYPSYDYLFGIPVKGKRPQKEVAFFCFRQGKLIKGFYFDSRELTDLVEAMTKIARLKVKRD